VNGRSGGRQSSVALYVDWISVVSACPSVSMDCEFRA
jgi:hypothetical protein